MSIVLAQGAREGGNTQGRAGPLMAEFGYYLEDMIPPTVHLVLLAVFMTVEDAGTPWSPQFFNSSTFESQRLTDDSPMVDQSHHIRSRTAIHRM